MKKRIVVVCPGRGTYTKDTIGYLKKYGGHVREFLLDIDNRRAQLAEPTVTSLDSLDVFKPGLHTKGEHASSLIYACAYADFMAIDREKYDIVAICGNSMGWYLTLAFGGSLNWEGGFEVIDTMGSMMKDEVIGGQVIYPICDDKWVISPEKIKLVQDTVSSLHGKDGCEVYTSIHLGGYVVLGANRAGCAALLKSLPKIDDYPFQLINHAAFHTPLLASTSERAFSSLPITLFHRPKIPLIDGRGVVWQPYSTDINELYNYTLGHQVVEPYDFSGSISVALKEFAPDHLVLLGPGGSLGGAIGQVMIANDWYHMDSKESFSAQQKEKPFLISMGREDQRI